MKKWIALILMITGVICMIGCSDTPETTDKMYIEPAQLTEEEEQIAALLGLNTKQRIFDFVLDETVQSMQVITSGNNVVSYQVDYFNSPEEYEKLGYEGVFAITVKFS